MARARPGVPVLSPEARLNFLRAAKIILDAAETIALGQLTEAELVECSREALKRTRQAVALLEGRWPGEDRSSEQVIDLERRRSRRSLNAILRSDSEPTPAA